MARLALVRKRREEAEARKAEEAAGEGESSKEKMEKEAKAKAGSGGPQKLNPLEVKSMYLYNVACSSGSFDVLVHILCPRLLLSTVMYILQSSVACPGRCAADRSVIDRKEETSLRVFSGCSFVFFRSINLACGEW